MAIPLGETRDITMAAEGKLQAEIERALFLVGILQEQEIAMDKQLTALISKTSNSIDGTEDLTLKDSAAELEKVSLKLEDKESGGQKVQEQDFMQQGDREAYWIMDFEKRKVKEEVFGHYRWEAEIMKKYNWDFLLFSGMGERDLGEHSAEPLQQVLPTRSDWREGEETALDIPRDLKINKKDYQQNRQRETQMVLEASDVRNPG